MKTRHFLGVARLVKRALGSTGITGKLGEALSPSRWSGRSAGRDAIEIAAREAAAKPVGGPLGRGQFVKGTFTNGAGTRTYKLYVPAGYRGAAAPTPLVVMLHGCTQTPDEFAAATRMNEFADRHGFVVVYPAQPRQANAARCWNWFAAQHQAREGGEPSIIAGITQQIAARLHIDRQRIYVAGHSAGAAMAVILGEAYPELYAAIGVHSGLPFRAAHDMTSAFTAMHSGIRRRTIPVVVAANGDATPAPAALSHPVPTIVFHGDNDKTVNALNGAAIAQQAIALAAAERTDAHRLRVEIQNSEAHGRSFQRTVHADADDRPLVEEWVLHGAGHSWSGGSEGKPFSDPLGPDASAEMVRFFLCQRSRAVGRRSAA